MVWEKEKIRVLEVLADAWTAAEISWAVCNGLDGYPEKVGRDLDVLTSPEDVQKAAIITVNTLREQGFCPLPFRLGWIYWIVGVRKIEDEIQSLQVDLFDHLQWAFTWVVDGGLPLTKNHIMEGPFPVDLHARIGKRLVINLLSGNFNLFKERPHYLELTASEAAALHEIIKRISGDGNNGALMEAIAERNLERIRLLIPKFRRKVLAYSCLPMQGFGRRVKSAFQKQWNMNLFPRPSVPVIAIQSIDHYRSRDVCDRLVELFSKNFVLCSTEILDQRPRFLFPRSQAFGLTATIDFIVGSYFKINKMSALQSVEIFCGHAFSLNQCKNINGMTRWLARSIPKPDLNFYLTAEEEEIDTVSVCEIFGVTEFLRDNDLENLASTIFDQFISFFGEKSERQCELLNEGRL